MCIRDRYYDALRQDMAERHPKASPYVLDHVLSLEAMLDIAILSGFSFGSGAKANLVAEKRASRRLGWTTRSMAQRGAHPSDKGFPSNIRASTVAAVFGLH